MSDSPLAQQSNALTTSRADRLVVTLALVFPTLVTVAYFVLAANASAGVQQAVYSFSKLLQFGLPVVWIALAHRQRLKRQRPTAAGLLPGALFGGVVMIATVIGYHWLAPSLGIFETASAAIQAKVLGTGIDTPAKYLVLGLFYSVGHSFLEEYYWRWFVFAELRRFCTFPTALVVSSLGFTAHHVLVLGTYFGWLSWATLALSLSVAIGGAFWAWLYERHGSIYAVWLSHLLIDAGIFWVGYELMRPAL